MENKPVFLSMLETNCKSIINSQYLKCIENDDIHVVLLSVFHLEKIINEHNLLLAVNMTKINNIYLQDLCAVLYKNVCIKNTEQKFKEFVYQFDVSPDYLKKKSLLIPYDVLANDLSKYTVDDVWVKSIASLATTEYIFSLLFEKLNKFSDNNKLKLDESKDSAIKLLDMLNSQQMYTSEIEKGICETVKAFLLTFEVLHEIFYEHND